MRFTLSMRTLLIGVLATALSTIAYAGESETYPSGLQPRVNIVVGFVGGFVAHDNPHHGPVQLAHRLQQTLPAGTYIRVFENRHRRQAYSAILQLLDSDRDGRLSAAEKSHAHIVLLGQSWGGAAVVVLARDLRRDGIPVMLTVQVDSVAKLWQNDSVIPDNVAEAVNFYQTHGIVHGRRRIVAADPVTTDILGNYLEDYRKNPVNCPEASWTDRFFTPGHMQSECDPRLWSQIEKLVQDRLVQPDNAALSETVRAVSTSSVTLDPRR